MSARILAGTATALKLRQQMAAEIAELKAKGVVGPMTIAMLLQNCLKAARRRAAGR